MEGGCRLIEHTLATRKMVVNRPSTDAPAGVLCVDPQSALATHCAGEVR